MFEEKLPDDAFHDPLTGLSNCGLFIEHLERALKRARRRKGYLFAALLLDLIRFKLINESLGYSTGDQLLIEVAGLGVYEATAGRTKLTTRNFRLNEA